MIDMDRPPVRLPPRTPLWVRLLILWAVLTVVYVVTTALLFLPGTTPSLALLLASILAAAGVGLSFTQLRFATSGSVSSRILEARGFPVGDPEDDERTSDPQERDARRRLRRHEITRAQYEQILARRRFAHGEITLAEYHEILREVADQSGRPSPGPPPPGT